MPSEIYLLKVGMTMTEGTVDEWYVEDGAWVSEGDDLYRLETEKVNMDVPAESDGVVKHLVPAGTECEPGDVVGWLYAHDEEIPAELPSGIKKNDIEVAEETEPDPADETKTSTFTGTTQSETRIKASPAARRLARERGVSLVGIEGSGPGGRITEKDVPEVAADRQRVAASPAARKLAAELDVELASIQGSGPRGRVVKEDVEAAASKSEATPSSTESTQVPIRGIRKTIAERMSESIHSSAQLTMDMEVSMDEAIKLRQGLLEEWQDAGPRVSYTDLVIVAVAKSLLKHPRVNSTLIDDTILEHSAAHIGIAVALPEGLIVPVLKSANTKSLREISIEASELGAKARDGSLSLDEVNDGTFTVTSLGMYGVDSFTPILNAPQTGILGVGRIYDGTSWIDEQPKRAQKMRLSLTWDHRVIDGAPAAEFLGEVCSYLAAPYRLLV